MLDILSDIKSQVERNRWVSDYEVFLQEIDRVQINTNDEISAFNNTKHNGIALRLLSRENRLVHFACSISMIPLLSNLNPPKSTQNIVDSKLFVKLKKSKIRAIPGDEGFTTNINKELIQKMTSKLLELDREDHIHNEQNLYLLKEKRVIFNTLSDPMTDTSFKMKYEVNTKFRDSSHYTSSYRYDMSRGYNIDFQEILNKSNQSLVHQNMSKLRVDLSSLASVVIHPRVVGQLLLGFAYNNLLDSHNPKVASWNKQLHLYDDPHKRNGWSSELFDDTGVLTKPTKIIEGGEQINSLVEQSGINYRKTWFNAIPRSYKNIIIPMFTNLVLTGGVGQGEKFLNRNGKVLYILDGKAVTSGNPSNLQYIIHTQEAELWNNYEFMGPINNISLQGSFNEMMSDGNISNDQVLVFDKSIPYSTYVGWLFIKPNLTSIG